MTGVVIDAGTTSVRAAAVDRHGVVGRESRRHTPPLTSTSDLVEFDAGALRDAALSALAEVVSGLGAVSSVGITNQRGSVVVWKRATGEPVGPGIGWQDLRTAVECAELTRSGLPISPIQSPTKAKWLWDRVDSGRQRDLCVGTIDSWLIWTLTDGAVHVTDASNAYASGFMSADGEQWNSTLLDTMRIPTASLPRIVDSIGSVAVASALSGSPRITAIAGDQQASMFGQRCVNAGDIKATFGTGGSLNACLAGTRPRPTMGAFPIIAWRYAGVVTWGLEAIMLTAGACVSWLCDQLGIIDSPADAESVAALCDNAGDVWFVPALGGLGSPYWDLDAKGTLLGLTRGTGRAEVVRAVLEGVAHRGADLLEAVLAEPEMLKLTRARGANMGLRVDGGMSANSIFVQALADATGRSIHLSSDVESTTVGVGLMAAVGDDLIDLDTIAASPSFRATVEPNGNADRNRWRAAVERARSS